MNLVKNGSFETPAITGYFAIWDGTNTSDWTWNGSIITMKNDTYSPSVEGNQYITLNFGTGKIQQTIYVPVSGVYTLSFYYGVSPGGIMDTFAVQLNGETFQSFTMPVGDNSWHRYYNPNLTLTKGFNSIEFLFPNIFEVDAHISVNLDAVELTLTPIEKNIAGIYNMSLFNKTTDNTSGFSIDDFNIYQTANINGDMSVSGNVDLGTNMTSTTVNIGGAVNLTNGDTSTTAFSVAGKTVLSGNITINGNVTCNRSITMGGSSTIQGWNAILLDTTNATSSITGALKITGGVGIQQDTYIGGLLNTTGNISSGGVISTTNATASTSSTTGALQVAGGCGIGGDLFVGGTIVGKKFSDNINTLTNATTFTIDYTNGQIYYVASSTNAKTACAFTNLPTTSGRSYCFTFIFTTTNSTNIIGSTATISVNGTTVTPFAMTPNTSTATVYFVETIVLMNVSGTWMAMGSYSGF
jgi:hypothetical protein